jgi:uncharacterized membrane protein YeaQ/YmgE (transglycosylase-associated protein family)
MQVMGTMLLGTVGAVIGGLISWAYWPDVDGQFHAGALLTSLIGAVVVVAGFACWTYARKMSVVSASAK